MKTIPQFMKEVLSLSISSTGVESHLNPDKVVGRIQQFPKPISTVGNGLSLTKIV